MENEQNMQNAQNPQNMQMNYGPPIMQNGIPVPPFVYGAPVIKEQVAPMIPSVKKAKEPFTATKTDFWMVVLAFVAGFIFIEWVFFAGWRGWGVTAFTFLYSVGVLAYARLKKCKPTKESWFWLGILLLTSATFALWDERAMALWRIALLFGTAIYWCNCLFGGLLQKKTGNYVLLDGINNVFVIPFRNFGLAFKSLLFYKREKEKTGKKKSVLLPIFLGIAILVPIFMLVLPQLIAADSGVFSDLMWKFTVYLQRIFVDEIGVYLWKLILSVLVGLYICGLVAGLAHKRYIGTFDLKKVQRNIQDARIIPKASILVILSGISLIYIVFILCQIPYYFSAFKGEVPLIRADGYSPYAAYARDGFFELCRVVVLNVVLLLAANILCKDPRTENRPLKSFNIGIAILTMILIATAFSKMMLYIAEYGLTPLRILTSVFMVFLAAIFIAVVVMQFKQFSIARFGAITGAMLLCALCVCNVNKVAVTYNAEQYLAGNLENFDVLSVYEAGPAAFEVGYKVWQSNMLEEEEQAILGDELGFLNDKAKWAKGTTEDSLAYYNIRLINW